MHQLFDLKSILLYMEFVNEDPNLFMVLQLIIATRIVLSSVVRILTG